MTQMAVAHGNTQNIISFSREGLILDRKQLFTVYLEMTFLHSNVLHQLWKWYYALHGLDFRMSNGSCAI